MKTFSGGIENKTREAAANAVELGRLQAKAAGLYTKLAEALRIREVCPTAFDCGPVELARLTLSKPNGTSAGIVYTSGGLITKADGEKVRISAADYDYIKTGER